MLPFCEVSLMKKTIDLMPLHDHKPHHSHFSTDICSYYKADIHVSGAMADVISHAGVLLRIWCSGCETDQHNMLFILSILFLLATPPQWLSKAYGDTWMEKILQKHHLPCPLLWASSLWMSWCQGIFGEMIREILLLGSG